MKTTSILIILLMISLQSCFYTKCIKPRAKPDKYSKKGYSTADRIRLSYHREPMIEYYPRKIFRFLIKSEVKVTSYHDDRGNNKIIRRTPIGIIFYSKKEWSYPQLR